MSRMRACGIKPEWDYDWKRLPITFIFSFQSSGFVGLSGDIKAIFTVEPGEVRYIGRLHIMVPRYLSHDRPYRFALQNALQTDVSKLAISHPDLANAVRDTPMELRAATPTP